LVRPRIIEIRDSQGRTGWLVLTEDLVSLPAESATAAAAAP
jgi:hypothetical protein